jgi:alpha-galactosidase
MLPSPNTPSLPGQFPVGLFGLAAASGLLTAQPSGAVASVPGEIAESLQWLATRFVGGPEAKDAPAFFSFTYGGQPSSELLRTWPLRRVVRQLDDRRTEHTLTYTDPLTGLVLRCVGVGYRDFPTVEWTLHFNNTGDRNTPILADIQAIDAGFVRPAVGEFTLHQTRGDFCTADSYEPRSEVLGPGAARRFAPTGGKSTNVQFPYWNVEMSGGGVLVAVGWPGQWSATFERDAGATLRVRAGQELTRFTLHPGEEVRSPLVVLQFYRGDRIRAQNLWRRWMLAHNTPRPAGPPLAPMLTFCSGGFFPGLRVSEASERQFIDTLVSEGIPIDYWWMDAGWYTCDDWFKTGTWEVDPARFPHGIKAVSDYVHDRKMKLIVWFEPERATPGTWLTLHHPEWIFGGEKGGVVNLGHPGAWAWIVDHFDQLITGQGVDLYRQDFNVDPLAAWRAHDPEDRQGITENKYICGYLAFWDELRRRHPGMLIDSCAGGGRRNDLETLRRAVPLLRSDYQSFTGDPAYHAGNQGQTYGLSSWIPFYGTGVYYNSVRMVEGMRSNLCPSFAICADVRKDDIDWVLYRKLIAQWRQVAGCMLGDFYPLTPYSLGADCWIAWQFDRPEQGDGLVQAFRRAENGDAMLPAKLRGLEPAAVYAVQNLDEESVTEATGRELMEEGLAIGIKAGPGSALIHYRKKS